MKAEHLLFRIAIATLLLCSLSLGGMDQSGNINAENMTISEFSTHGSGSAMRRTPLLIPVRLRQTSDGWAEQRWPSFTEQAPPTADLNKLMPSAVLNSPPRFMYYNGNYLPWNDFSTTYPSNSPGLWIERAVGWTLYATLPRGGWTRELIYVPQASPSQYVRDLSRRLCAGDIAWEWSSPASTTSGTMPIHQDGIAAYSPPIAGTAMQ